jgi:hypothetical protein
MAMTKASCQLYKAIFVSVVRHNRAHGETGFIAVDELYQRLQDTIMDLKSEPDFRLTLPPFAIYLESIDRMLAEGFLLEESSSRRSLGSKAKRDVSSTYSRAVKMTLDVSDLLTALKGDCFEKKL